MRIRFSSFKALYTILTAMLFDFDNRDTQAQRDGATCPMLRSSLVAELGLEPRFPNSESMFVSPLTPNHFRWSLHLLSSLAREEGPPRDWHLLVPSALKVAWVSQEGSMEAALQAGHHFRRKPVPPSTQAEWKSRLCTATHCSPLSPIPPAPCVLVLSQGLELNAFWLAASQADTQVVRGVGRVRQRCQLA